MSSYKFLDTPLLLQYLFFPQSDFSPCPENSFDLMVPVDEKENVAVSCRFYSGDKHWPWILYFHGNGEVVSDYDYIAPLYHREKLNLVVSDYRGYGASSGRPTFQALIEDSHDVLKKIQEELIHREYSDRLFIMGRSMGSIAALELARQYPLAFKGLIIESGFICVTRLIKHLGLPSQGMDLDSLEKECLEKAKGISIPSLVIHGQNDKLVPLQEGKDLHNELDGSQKKLLVIREADHNNIMFIKQEQYFKALHKFCYTW
ncbi:alpha/beta hydrolase [Candidatus Contubernalis alkaliaceticus]|uniref:alpha/beta hydrolase n=1 Tax=Candidatus Contubernalis alkaliaceticus TaxID=338645 RepID=UPI001F4C4AB5|nr:alpha/beta fold hydrolase [Candidatus Contubernalis alkalaceticus]UNC93249.1 alpha/beta hydrolase [Candidatus Contubernalis alkalaceticus]